MQLTSRNPTKSRILSSSRSTRTLTNRMGLTIRATATDVQRPTAAKMLKVLYKR